MQATREAGGDLGWIGMADEFLEDVVPQDVRATALKHKPGDVVKVIGVKPTHIYSRHLPPVEAP